MDNIYNNAGFESNVDKEQFSDVAEPKNDDDDNVYEMDEHSTARDHTEIKNGDDEYVNVKNMDGHPRAKHHTDVPECKNTPSKRNVMCPIFILLLFGTLTALGFLYYLYFMQSASLGNISEQFANATALIKMQVNKTAGLEQAFKQLEKERELIQEVLSKAQKAARLCDGGWMPFGSMCYLFSTNKLDWMQSRDDCVIKGGHLVIITSPAEENFLLINGNEPHWIGLNDLKTEGQWMWVNGQTLDETGVNFWFHRTKGQNEPDNWTGEDSTGEDCACLWDDNTNYAKWFDASCRKAKNYICQREK